MSDLWTGGRDGTVWLEPPPDHRTGSDVAAVYINVEMGDGDLLTPDECDALAAALQQAAAKKRSEDRVRQLEQEGKASK